MNAKNVSVILAVVCAVLLGGLIYRHTQAVAQQHSDEKTILDLRTNWANTSKLLDDTREEKVLLSKSLEDSRNTGSQLSHTLAAASNLLTTTEADFAKTSAELKDKLKAAEDDLAKDETRIKELTTQNAALDKQAGDLKTAIDGLEQAIADTKRKLESAEGDKVVLQAELKRLMTDKAELERQFNDITVLRTQLAKLKEELSIARRLDWIRRGLYGDVKGGQRMLQLSGVGEQSAKPAQGTNYDLNVEVKSDGSLKVIPPPGKSP